jgi:ribosomal protein S19E (S16A)
MYIRRIPGPVSVTLPDGTQMTRADLPGRDTHRWVASRKAAVVRAVDAGLITVDEAVEMYGLSLEELDSWRQAVARHGVGALRATAIQQFRP